MKIKNNSAIALILSVGVLAILALITVGFSAFTKMELKATENQINLLKASYIAQAGIARVIGDIKYDSAFGAVSEPYDSAFDPWYYPGNTNYDGSNIDLATADLPSYGGDISYADGSYRLKVIDCGGLININCPLPDTDAENDLKNILNELGDILGISNLDDIVDYRLTLPGNIFTTKEEIKLVSGIGKATYEAVKDYITLWGDEDDGIIELDKAAGSPISPHTGKSFINVNTAPIKVLSAVLRPMMNSNTQADNLAAAIKARRAANPFDGLHPDADVDNFLSARGEFERFIEDAYSSGTISEANCNAVLSQSDPNSYVPAPSDPNSMFLSKTNSTDSAIFGFDANGYYEIEAIGTYRGAKKRIKQVVSIFRKINQTTKDEFSTNSSFPATQRVSWKDTCPVDFTLLKQFQYDDDAGDDPDFADYILNSLKLGFWDNFQEDYDPTAHDPVSGVLGPWQVVYETFTINDGDDGLLRTWASGGIALNNYFPRLNLDKNVCIVDDFAMIVHAKDEDNIANSKYGAQRPDLPWPAIPLEWAWIEAPPPDATNCPDIAADTTGTLGPYLAKRWKSTDPMFPPLNISIHQQYINTFHARFGGIFTDVNGVESEKMSAIFCNVPQVDDRLIPPTPVYQNWVKYNGGDYIYFTPSPDTTTPGWESPVYQTCRKPYSVISGSNVMVSCNEWYGTGIIPFYADDAVEYFPIIGNVYQPERTFHLIGIGDLHTRGEVYFDTADTVIFETTHYLMVWEDRYFQFSGMDNFPDVDYFRVVPGQGAYTSQMFSPAGITLDPVIEWGTIRAHVTLPATADPAIDDADFKSEVVYLVTADSAILSAPAPSYIPSPVILPSGGPVVLTNSQSICYQAYLFSDFNKTGIANIDFEQAPVVEDVTITYLPKTRIVYYNAI